MISSWRQLIDNVYFHRWRYGIAVRVEKLVIHGVRGEDFFTTSYTVVTHIDNIKRRFSCLRISYRIFYYYFLFLLLLLLLFYICNANVIYMSQGVSCFIWDLPFACILLS